MLFPVRLWISDIYFYKLAILLLALSVLINAFARVGNTDLC